MKIENGSFPAKICLWKYYGNIEKLVFLTNSYFA